MNRGWLRYVSSVVTLLAAMNFLSCGNKRRLVSIDVVPPGATFFTPDPSSLILFKANGTYRHPPDVRDITNTVMWTTDNPQLIVVNKGTVSPQPGGVCGVGNIYANVNDSGNLVSAFATITVNDPNNKLCPGGNASKGVVSVTLLGPASAGSVTSAPAGITCPPVQSCFALFNVGDTIGLNAAPSASHTFSGWSGCSSTSGTTCSILVPSGSTNVTATFN